MANYTKKAILYHFERMLFEMPFEKITVCALVGRCEVSSNTFYYHFRDIYDLLDVWMNEKKKEYLEEVESPIYWTDRLKIALKKLQENSTVVYHLFDSISRERMEHFVFVVLEKDFYIAVKESLIDHDIPEESLQDLSAFCCYSTLGFVIKFLWDRMDVNIEESVERLSKTFEGVIQYIAVKNSGDT